MLVPPPGTTIVHTYPVLPVSVLIVLVVPEQTSDGFAMLVVIVGVNEHCARTSFVAKNNTTNDAHNKICFIGREWDEWLVKSVMKIRAQSTRTV